MDTVPPFSVDVKPEVGGLGGGVSCDGPERAGDVLAVTTRDHGGGQWEAPPPGSPHFSTGTAREINRRSPSPSPLGGEGAGGEGAGPRTIPVVLDLEGLVSWSGDLDIATGGVRVHVPPPEPWSNPRDDQLLIQFFAEPWDCLRRRYRGLRNDDDSRYYSVVEDAYRFRVDLYEALLSQYPDSPLTARVVAGFECLTARLEDDERKKEDEARKRREAERERERWGFRLEKTDRREAVRRRSWSTYAKWRLKHWRVGVDPWRLLRRVAGWDTPPYSRLWDNAVPPVLVRDSVLRFTSNHSGLPAIPVSTPLPTLHRYPSGLRVVQRRGYRADPWLEVDYWEGSDPDDPMVPMLADLSHLRRPQACDGRVVHVACPHGHDSVPAKVWQGCGQVSCGQAGCIEKQTTRRAKTAYEMLAKGGDAAWSVAVLTLPWFVWGRVRDPDSLADLRRAAIRVVRAWSRRWQFGGRDVGLGGYAVVHPCGEAADRHWQPHVNVIWSTAAVCRGAWLRGRMRVSREALDDLRVRWRRAVEEFLGVTFEGALQVFYEFRRGGKKVHAARYFFRHFHDFAGWVMRKDPWGWVTDPVVSLPRADRVEWSSSQDPHVCPVCGAYRVEVGEGLIVSGVGPPFIPNAGKT